MWRCVCILSKFKMFLKNKKKPLIGDWHVVYFVGQIHRTIELHVGVPTVPDFGFSRHKYGMAKVRIPKL